MYSSGAHSRVVQTSLLFNFKALSSPSKEPLSLRQSPLFFLPPAPRDCHLWSVSGLACPDIPRKWNHATHAQASFTEPRLWGAATWELVSVSTSLLLELSDLPLSGRTTCCLFISLWASFPVFGCCGWCCGDKGVHVWVPPFTTFGWRPKSGITRPYGNCLFDFLR